MNNIKFPLRVIFANKIKATQGCKIKASTYTITPIGYIQNRWVRLLICKALVCLVVKMSVPEILLFTLSMHTYLSYHQEGVKLKEAVLKLKGMKVWGSTVHLDSYETDNWYLLLIFSIDLGGLLAQITRFPFKQQMDASFMFKEEAFQC